MSAIPAWLQILSALMTPTIGLAVVVIAYQQWRTARDRLVLELFEKRMAVYDQVKRAVSAVNARGATDDNSDRDLLEAIEMSKFLFGEDIREYLEGLWRDFSKLRVVSFQLRSSDQDIRTNAAEKQGDIFNRITRFYYDGADRFAPYMRMDQRRSNWRPQSGAQY